MRGGLYWDDGPDRSQTEFVVVRQNLGRLIVAVPADLLDCGSTERTKRWEGSSVRVVMEMHMWQAKHRGCSYKNSQMNDDSL